MMHLTFADKNLMTGDAVADLLMEYTAALANDGAADTVKVKCIGADGADVIATFVLGEGTPLMAETSPSTQSEPDNSLAIAYMTGRLQQLAHVPRVSAEPDAVGADFADHFDEAL